MSQILRWSKGKIDFTKGCVVMGILNVTPDSFSDGGDFYEVENAVLQGFKMEQDGAAILDIGAESSRPGARPVPSEEQIKRAVPVIRELYKKVKIPISIDTTDPVMAEEAIKAGASIINDISAIGSDDMIDVVKSYDVPIILMHMQKNPLTMQQNPVYRDVVEDVLEYLLKKAKRAEDAGIEREKIFIDPGIGFGKTMEHNLLLLKHIGRFVDTDYRVLMGTSRKRFIGTLTKREEPKDRAFGTAATVAICAEKGVSVVRVHDVEAMVDVVKVANAIREID